MTEEEYFESLNKQYLPTGMWSDPLFECPNCGGHVVRNESYILTSYPPKHMYKCFNCGYESVR